MTGDVSEAMGAYLLRRFEGLTRGNGYDLPEDFLVITREVLDISQFAGFPMQLPALVLMTLETTPVHKLSYVIEETARFQATLFFQANYEIPASDANRYKQAVRQRLIQDIHLGGLVDMVQLIEGPPPGLWEGTGLQAIIVPFQVIYEIDSRLPAVPVAS